MGDPREHFLLLEQAYAELANVMGQATDIERASAELVQRAARLANKVDAYLRANDPQLKLPFEGPRQ